MSPPPNDRPPHRGKPLPTPPSLDDRPAAAAPRPLLPTLDHHRQFRPTETDADVRRGDSPPPGSRRRRPPQRRFTPAGPGPAVEPVMPSTIVVIASPLPPPTTPTPPTTYCSLTRGTHRDGGMIANRKAASKLAKKKRPWWKVGTELTEEKKRGRGESSKVF